MDKEWITSLEAGKVLYFRSLAFEPLPEELSLFTPAIRDPKSRNISFDANDRLKGAACEAATQQALAAIEGEACAGVALLPSGLSAISTALMAVAGAGDHITPAAQVFAAARYVGTPAADITTATTTGGHLGLFMGTEALRDFWPDIFTDIARRSRRSAPATAGVRASVPPEPPVPAP